MRGGVRGGAFGRRLLRLCGDRDGGGKGNENQSAEQHAAGGTHGSATSFKLSGRLTTDFGVRSVSRSTASAGGFSASSIFTILSSRPPLLLRPCEWSSEPSAFATSTEMSLPSGSFVSRRMLFSEGSSPPSAVRASINASASWISLSDAPRFFPSAAICSFVGRSLACRALYSLAERGVISTWAVLRDGLEIGLS